MTLRFLVFSRQVQGMALVCFDDLVSGSLVRLSRDVVSRGRAFILLQGQSGGGDAAAFGTWVEAWVAAGESRSEL